MLFIKDNNKANRKTETTKGKHSYVQEIRTNRAKQKFNKLNAPAAL